MYKYEYVKCKMLKEEKIGGGVRESDTGMNRHGMRNEYIPG